MVTIFKGGLQEAVNWIHWHLREVYNVYGYVRLHPTGSGYVAGTSKATSSAEVIDSKGNVYNEFLFHIHTDNEVSIGYYEGRKCVTV